MSNDNSKTFLDYTGVETLVSNIKDNFLSNTGENSVGRSNDPSEYGEFTIIHGHNENTYLSLDNTSITLSTVDDVAHPSSELILSAEDDYSLQQAVLRAGSEIVVNEERVSITGDSVTINVDGIDDDNNIYNTKVEILPETVTINGDNVTLNGDSVTINSDNVTINDNKILTVDDKNIVNTQELTIGGFEIKNDEKYNYIIEGHIELYDWGYQYYAVDDCTFVAEYTRAEPEYHVLDDNDVLCYSFIVTNAQIYHMLDTDSDYHWDEYTELIGKKIFIPCDKFEALKFTDDISNIDSLYISSEDRIYNCHVIRSKPYTLKHTSKALLNDIEVATVDKIPTSLPANGGNADTVDGKHAVDFASVNHTHNRFTSDTVHFEGAIHICNISEYEDESVESGPITGIYFSDGVEDMINNNAYAFIREEGDDVLRVHSNYEVKLSTGGYAEGNWTENIDGPNIRIIYDADEEPGANTIQMNAYSGVFVNGKQIATEKYVNDLVKGGVHFRGVYDRLPDELTSILDYEDQEVDNETKQIGRWFNDEEDIEVIFYEGDIIIVSPNVSEGGTDGESAPEEPTKEYILTYANGAINEWHWVELGDVTPAQNLIDESLKNYYNKSEIDTKVDNIEEVTSTALTDLNNKISTVDNKINNIDTPIVNGNVNNSAVLDGEYTVNGTKYNNKAISQVSMAIGAASTSGLKGWYYTKVNLSENLIWLSDTRSTGLFQIKISETTQTIPDPDITQFDSGWKVGDEVTIVNDKKYDRCAKIESINGNMIKLDKLPFDSETIVKSAASVGNYNEPDEFSITAIRITDNDTFKTRTLSSYDKGNIDFGGGAHAEGVQTYALNIGAHAEGIQTIAHGQYSHTEGFRTEAAYAAHAEGRQSKALGRQSHAEGENTEAHGDNSHVEGKNSKTLSKFSHAEGNTTIAKGEASHTEGYKTISVNNTSHAEGSQTVAYGGNAHAEGQGGSYDAEIYNKTNEEIVELWDAEMKINCALGKSSHTEGLNTLAAGDYSHAEGQYTKAAGSDSHAEGNKTKALENNAHAEGVSSVALGNAAHAEGNTTISSGKASHAEGIETIASKDGAHSEGYKTEASELYAHAEGNETKASGKYSHTEGYMTEATTNNAHAEGNQTKAQGNSAHAEGKLTVAAKDFSHAGGLSSTAEGICSFAHGNYIIATKDYETAFGKYNKSNTNTIFSIGNGTDENNRRNILELTTSPKYELKYCAPKTDIIITGGYYDAEVLKMTYISANSNYATYRITQVDISNYKDETGKPIFIKCVNSAGFITLSVGDLLYVPIVKPEWELNNTTTSGSASRFVYISTTFTDNNALNITDGGFTPKLVQLEPIVYASSSLFAAGTRVLVEDDEYIYNTKLEILSESHAYTDNKLNNIDANINITKSEILAESKAYTDNKFNDIDIPLQATPNGGIISITDDIVRPNEASGKSSFAIGGYVADSGNIYNGCNALGSASFSGGVDNYSNGICSFTYGFGLNTTTASQKYGEAAFGKYNNSASDTLFSVGNGTNDNGRKNAFEVKTNGRVYASSFYETSDERIKIFTKPIETDLDKLSALRKSYFTYVEAPGTTQIGVSAQEVQKLYPEIVTENSNGLLTVDYSKLSVIALNAIDDLHKKNKELEDRLAKLESIVKNM